MVDSNLEDSRMPAESSALRDAGGALAFCKICPISQVLRSGAMRTQDFVEGDLKNGYERHENIAANHSHICSLMAMRPHPDL